MTQIALPAAAIRQENIAPTSMRAIRRLVEIGLTFKRQTP
jgi:hypothetical protein